jgi:hypothetical protein
MESNEILREQIFEIIKNQISSNDPQETNLTYKRLIDLGYNDFETNQLIGQCVAIEIFNVIKYKMPFNEKRYIKNLEQLPKKPMG